MVGITDHGIWRPYKPDPLPQWALDAIEGGSLPDGMVPMFLQREDDGADWYEHRNDEQNWTQHSVICTVLADPATGIETVKAVFRDRMMQFPINQRLIEITGHDVEDDKPHNEFAWMIYDPADKTLSPAASPQVLTVQSYQFAGQAAAEGIITDQEALDWVTIGKTPTALIEAVKANVPDPERRQRVLLFLAGTYLFPLLHPLTPLLGASFGKNTPELLRKFFNDAGAR